MLFELPFHTFDEAHARGRRVKVRCLSCKHHHADIDPDDPRLRGKSFCRGVRFRCTRILKRRLYESAPTPCPGHGYIAVWPGPENGVQGRKIRYMNLYCTGCEPIWWLHECHYDAPPWRDIVRDRRFEGFRCPTCRGKLGIDYHCFNWIPSARDPLYMLEHGPDDLSRTPAFTVAEEMVAKTG